MTTATKGPLFAEDVLELQDFPLREGLTWRQRKEAEFLYTLSRGVMLTTGQPGSGKDLFSIALAAEMKYYFGRRILLDFLPCKAFGEYTLFNGRVMMQEINKMAKRAGNDDTLAVEEKDDKLNAEKASIVEDAAKRWVEGEGEVLLKGSVLYLQELKRYCYNRNPHNPFNKFIGSIATVWRHLDLLMMGTHVHKHEIDQYSYLAYVTHWAKCSWSLTRPDTTNVTIQRGAFVGVNNVYDVQGKPIIMHVNGRKPRGFLDGANYYGLYQSKSYVNLKPVIRKD